MADNLDVFVALQTKLYDPNGNGAGQGAQVIQAEGYFFRYRPATDDWIQSAAVLLGDPDEDWLSKGQHPNCERPDVIASGNTFLVSWTRRYRISAENAPAVLEVATCWWDPSGNGSLVVVNGGLPRGRGFPLDSNYLVRDCSGVADTVLLHTSADQITAGVVYPAQTEFSSTSDGNRTFEIRIASFTLDTSTATPTLSTEGPWVLHDDVPFDGELGIESNTPVAGVVLPDATDTGTNDRFFLAYEDQKRVWDFGANALLRRGRIHLEVVQAVHAIQPGGAVSVAGWEVTDSHVFGSSTDVLRRRANLSSFPDADPAGEDHVAIAFGKLDRSAGDDREVVFEHWSAADSGLVRVDWPNGAGWQNSPTNDDWRSVPLLGTQAPLVARCLAERAVGTTGQIVRYDVASDTEDVVFSGTKVQRPAVDGVWPGGAETTIASWEADWTDPNSNTTVAQVFLLAD